MWPSMTDGPTWPGAGEYLYQAASLGLATRGGTCIVPLLFSPSRMSFEFTPIAGIRMAVGTERGSVGPFGASSSLASSPAQGRVWLPADTGMPPDPEPVAVLPAADRAGCGAWCWLVTATPMAVPPPAIRIAAAIPAIFCVRAIGLRFSLG